MSMESRIDSLGSNPGKSMTMKEAILVLKNNPVFYQLVHATATLTTEQKKDVFKAIAVMKATIVKNAFSNTEEGEDVEAFESFPGLFEFVDTLMEGLSNA